MTGTMEDTIRKRFEESMAVAQAARDLLAPRVAQAAEIIVAAYKSGNGVFTFGNGGSAADALHIAGELEGRFLRERRPFKAEALCGNTALISALANDYNWEIVFARQLEANGRAGDVAIALSTSGNSPNVVMALAKARAMGMKTIGLTGQGGGRCRDLCDVLLEVPTKITPRIQESHIILYHVLCELVETALSNA